MSRLHAVKGGPCRVCHGPYDELYALVPLHRGGRLVADNLVPLCCESGTDCLALVQMRDETALLRIGLSLSAAERSYVASTAGHSYLGRRYRVWLTRTHVIGAKEEAA